MTIPRPVASLVVAVATLVGLSGCTGGSAATAGPAADFAGIVEQLAKAGIAVQNVVSGDAGCADETLTRTAVGFDASGLDQPALIRIRVYIFKNRAAWERLSGSVAACARGYVTDPSTYESLAPSPYVVSGQGPWSPRFATALKTAFVAASGSGD